MSRVALAKNLQNDQDFTLCSQVLGKLLRCTNSYRGWRRRGFPGYRYRRPDLSSPGGLDLRDLNTYLSKLPFFEQVWDLCMQATHIFSEVGREVSPRE